MDTDREKRLEGGRLKHKALTDTVIGAFYQVYNELGYGFLEAVYEQAMVIELEKRGVRVERQAPITVQYDGQEVGHYFADLLVDEKVLVELKAARALAAEHEAQLLNYLKATLLEVGLLLNFGPKAQLRRKIFDNAYKGTLSWTQDKPK
jgi:GxxExxY protein